MNTVGSIVRMHMRDRLSWFLLPWIIVSSSFVVNLLIAGMLTIDNPIVTGGLGSIFIYMLVNGIIGVQHTFPFALGMSVVRRDYYSGTMIMIAVVSVITGILLTLLSAIESSTNGWGVRLWFFHLPYLADGNAAQQLIVFASLMLFTYVLGFAIACIFRRFGKFGLYALAIAMLLFGTLFAYALKNWNWWDGISTFFDAWSAFHMGLLLIPVSAVLSLISYGLLRRSTV